MTFHGKTFACLSVENDKKGRVDLLMKEECKVLLPYIIQLAFRRSKMKKRCHITMPGEEQFLFQKKCGKAGMIIGLQTRE